MKTIHMGNPPRTGLRFFAAALALVCLMACTRPANALTIKEEDEMAREFMRVVASRFEFIEDPQIVSYVNQVGRKILQHVPEQPFQFRFYVIKEDVYNAFALPAGHIFVNSGLLAAMESEAELAGILGHEIAHVTHRHISKRIEQSSKLNLATMAGLMAGVFLGMAGGSPDAAQALVFGSAAAGQTAALSYSREDESQADQAGVQYIRSAGYSMAGLQLVLTKIRGKQWFGTNQVPTYMMTHPAVEERLSRLDSWAATESRGAGVQQPETNSDPMQVLRYAEMKMRLKALYDPAETALAYYQAAVSGAAGSGNKMDQYGYGLVLARVGRRDEAIAALKGVLSIDAFDAAILSDLGRIYFLDGRYEQALSTLESAVSLPQVQPEGLFYLGRTRMELGRLQPAVEAFERMLDIYPDYRPAYQLLGEAYGKMGKMPEAHFYLGVYNYSMGDYRTARYHLTRAKQGLNDSARLESIDKILKNIAKVLKPQAETGSIP